MSVGWDQEAALKGLDGDESLLSEMIAVFFEEYPTYVGGLHRALLHKDLNALQETANALAGSLASLGATDAKNLALALERACQERNFLAAPELTARLRTNIDDLRRLLIEGEVTREAIIE
jgi:HPt (histidine-containing phosphotransfer) domain-containing protein